MKTLIMFCIIICACGLEIEEGIAQQQPRCYSNPYDRHVICEDRGHIQPWIDNRNSYDTPYTRKYPPYQPQDNKSIEIHNNNECHLAIGCIKK
jgi:hypothetical protein